jgi:hypothetical protein
VEDVRITGMRWAEWVSTAAIDSGLVQAAYLGYLLTVGCCLLLGPALLSAVCSLASGRDDADGGREMTRKGGTRGESEKS